MTRRGRWFAWGPAVVLLIACGGREAHRELADATSGGTSSELGGFPAAEHGGAAEATGGTTVSGGAPAFIPLPPMELEAGAVGVTLPRPCNNPRDLGGGFVQCGDGSYRRMEPKNCGDPLPRAEPGSTCHAGAECCADSDCASAPHGYCSYGACIYGCVSDTDCGLARVCFCGDPVGVCVTADCSSSAQCGDKGCAAGGPLTYLHFDCLTPFICLTSSDCQMLGGGTCVGGTCTVLPG